MSGEVERNLSVNSVRAKSFSIVDDQENVCALLSSSPNGGVFLHLNDKDGRPRIHLQVDDEGLPSIALFTENNAPALSMILDPHRGNGLTISDTIGRPMIMIGIPEPGVEDMRHDEPHGTVFDRDGEVIWSTSDND